MADAATRLRTRKHLDRIVQREKVMAIDGHGWNSRPHKQGIQMERGQITPLVGDARATWPPSMNQNNDRQPHDGWRSKK